jgi:hypothetical protein
VALFFKKIKSKQQYMVVFKGLGHNIYVWVTRTIMKVEMIFFLGGKHGLFLDMGRQKFHGFIETYYQRLVQNDDKEAIVDPEIIEGLPG